MSLESITLTNEQLTTMMVTMEQGKLIPNPAVESIKNKRLPIKLQYELRKIFNQLATEFKFLEEMRQETIKRFTQLGSDGTPLIVMKDYVKIPEFLDKLAGCGITELDKAMKGEFVSAETAKQISQATDNEITADSIGRVALTDSTEFQAAVKELMLLNVNINLPKITLDFALWDDPKYDVWTGIEMDLLIPLLNN